MLNLPRLRFPRGALFIATVLALSLVRAGPAEAHASFVRSDPPADSVLAASPPRIQIWFTEPLESGFSTIQVLDARSQRQDEADAAIAPGDRTSMTVSLKPVPDGSYTVAWTALSSLDGHVTRGVFSLFIGVPATPRTAEVITEANSGTPWEAGARWLVFLGAALTLGTLVFRAFVLEPVVRRANPAAPPPLPRPAWLMAAGWIMLALGTAGGLAVQVVAVGNEATIEGAAALLTSTRYGALLQVRLVLLALAGILLWAGRQEGRAVAGALLLGVLATVSMNSHGAAAEPAALAIASDWLHSIAVAVWAGGLANLALGSRSVIKGTAEGWPLLGAIVLRFSNAATIAVAVVLVTGIYQSDLHVGGPGALTGTLFGRSLMAKIALFGVLLVLGGFNHFYIGPRLARSSGAGVVAAARMFKRTIGAEAVLVVLALLAAGLLTSVPPARGTYDQLQAQRGLTLTATARGLQLALNVAPGRPGVNRYQVAVTDNAGQAVVDAERVDVNFNYLDSALGAKLERMEPAGGGRYVATGGTLALEGRWQADLLVRRPGQEDVRTAFRFRVTPMGAQAEAAGAPPAAGFPAFGLVNLAAWFFAVVTLLGAGAAAKRLGVRTLEGGATTAAGLLLAALMVFVAVRTEPAVPPPDVKSVVNPFPATDDSIRSGEAIYQANCLSCHGVTGRGDGPAGLVLNPKPADFRIHMAAGHTDGELFNWLSNGFPGTAMPAFGDKLTEEQRWHAINFIRTFAPSDR
ncbi:MAG: c-type cytochrome [Dehalococcoidia bacterium]|nr:c-type cytochrome [Dehalococcoidia bacterium]